MSTIKSSDEHLTLNADGTSKDIKFQANGVEKASIDSSGNLTVSGNLTSLGIDDNADATAITIDSNENVGIGTSPSYKLHTLIGSGEANGVGILNTSGQGLNIYTDSTAANADVSIDQGATGAAIIFRQNGTERLRLAGGGNVGIANTSPNSYDAEAKNLVVGSGTGHQGMTIVAGTSSKSKIHFADGTGAAAYKGMVHYDHNADTLNLATSGNDRLSITSSGNVGIGGTPGDKLDVFGGVGMFRRSDVNSGSAERIVAFKDGSNTERGSIKISNSAVTYTTGSDYRLKENVDYTWDATTRLKQLKPARFNFIADDTNTLVDGFIAHEVSSVVPEAISGEKDAFQVWEAFETLPEGVSVGDNKLDDDGNRIPLMQSIDQSKLVPLLVKTIQELEARITALEA
jgi:hypothetical protein